MSHLQPYCTRVPGAHGCDMRRMIAPLPVDWADRSQGTDAAVSRPQVACELHGDRAIEHQRHIPTCLLALIYYLMILFQVQRLRRRGPVGGGGT